MLNEERICHKLTHPQKRIWYIDKVNLNSPLHNIGGCMNINGIIDIEMMKRTINILIENNEGLRLRFTEIDGQPVQYVSKFENQDLDFFDFSKYEKSEEEHKKWSEDTFKKVFNICNNPLFYFALYKINEENFGLLVIIHHIISDGWSITLIEKQICEIYSKLINNNHQDIFFHENYSYIYYLKDEEEYINSNRFIKNKCFWNDKFKDAPQEFMYNTSNSTEGIRKSVNIDIDLTDKIKKFIENKKCSLNTFFIAIIIIYLFKTTNKKDLVIGTPVFNRVNRNQKFMVGMFTSTVPFRFMLNAEINIDVLMSQVNNELKLCLSNQKYPYDLLIKDLELSKLGYDSLFKLCVNYYNTKFINDINGIEVSAQEYYCGNQSYSLQLTVKEWEESKITLNFDYKTLEYTEQEIKAMQRAIINIATQIVTNKELTVDRIKLLNKEEINYKLYDLNETNRCYPKKTVCELFVDQANKHPDKIALEFKNKALTYQALNEKSNQLAHYLLEKNIGKKSIVSIMATHSIELIIGIIGILKLGCSYLPIDPNYPLERINYILKDSKSSLLLTNFEVDKDIELMGNIINMQSMDLNFYSKDNLAGINDMEELVYIIYTSGSTGKPKGVMINHKGLTNYIWWAGKMYFTSENEAMALYSSISFDLTVTSIFTPLVFGNKIIIYDDDETEFVLYKILRENKVTAIKLTPAHLTLLKDMDYNGSNIKRLIVGGDDLKTGLAKEISNRFGHVEIYNEYGPTETVVGCMIYKYDEKKDTGLSVPIGYPIDNVQVYILDDNLEVIPTGLKGEIYISGDGVAIGYVNSEELTCEKFIENPFISGRRMYRTGDMARYLENGSIEYIGRIDNQVKIRGYRVELGEIEKYLVKIEPIKDAVVVLKKDLSGNEILNAYIASEIQISDKELKSRLLKYLPQYMIPANFIFMNKLPLTLNGKINHALLPEPIIAKREFAESKTKAEKELIKAMREILMIESIDINDNFYQLGGDSIKAIQISSRLYNAGFTIKAKDILAYEVVGEIAAHVEEISNGEAIDQSVIFGDFKQTPIIKWFFSQNFVNINHYNQSVLLKFDVPHDVDNIKKAIIKLIEHHDSLRLNYKKENNALYYKNEYLSDLAVVDCYDLSAYSMCEQNNKIKELGFKLKSSFNIEKSILFKSCIFYLGERGQVLLMAAHHLVVDGVSWRIILEDFADILKQVNSSQEIKLPLKTHSFMKWSDQLYEFSNNTLDIERRYWTPVLKRSFCFPFDFDLGADSVDKSLTLHSDIDKESAKKILTVVKDRYGVELHEVLIIALAMVIGDITKLEDVIIELESHGRELITDQINISRTVGWFTSLYPVQFKISDESLDFNIKYLKEQIRNIPDKGFSFGILKYLKNEFNENNNRYIRFNYLGDFDNIHKKMFKLLDIDSGSDVGSNNSLTAALDITAMILDEKLSFNIVYSKNKFQEETIQDFMDKYIGRINEIIELSYSESDKRFTPSDFTALNISQEDLDSLF